MRQYEPVWIKLKLTNKATVRVVPALAETVRKAVKKEKNQDLGFKVTHDYDAFYLKISYDETTKLMTFELKQRLGIE